MTVALANTVNRPLPDPIANLGASLLVATWTVALLGAHRAFQQDQDVSKANTSFLELIDREAKRVKSALEGTPYV